MSLMKQVKNTDKAEVQGDFLGGYSLLDTDVYTATIKAAFIIESKNGALGCTIHADTATGQSIRETIYFTNRNKETYYERDGKTNFLPGYNLLNALSMLTLSTEFADVDTEERIIKLYDYDAEKEVNTAVDMIVDLIGQDIKIAVEKQLVDKTAKSDDGTYQPTGETREINAMTHFFHAEKEVTLTEAIAKVEPAFIHKWLAKNKDQVINKSKGVAGGNAKAGVPSTASTGTGSEGKTASKRKSLFE